MSDEPKRILIVDDDAELRAKLKKTLEEDFEVYDEPKKPVQIGTIAHMSSGQAGKMHLIGAMMAMAGSNPFGDKHMRKVFGPPPTPKPKDELKITRAAEKRARRNAKRLRDAKK